jgi:type I restriction enzyme S subunit
MQQLFPAEGEREPKLRFKAFSGAWVEKKLGDVGSFKSGVGFTEFEQGGKLGVPFFKVSDMNLESNQKVMTLANNYVSDEQIARLNYKPINKKSVIFAKVGAAVFLERKRVADSFLIDNNMMAFTPITHIDFIRQWFDTVKLSKYAQVGALPSYNASDLKIIKIKLPKPKEQQKIANTLSTLDNLIEAQNQKIAQLKQHKNHCPNETDLR